MPLPIVKKEILNSFVRDNGVCGGASMREFIFENLGKIKRENPWLGEMISDFYQENGSHAWVAGAVLIYKLLSIQQEVDELNQQIS